MDIKGKLWDIITENVWSDRGSRDVCGVEESVQAIIDYLPEFIVLSDKDKPQVGDGVYVAVDNLYGTYTISDKGENIVMYGLGDGDYVDYPIEEMVIVRRKGLPALIRKGE